MDVLILTVFVSLTLVVFELIFFAWNLHHGAHDHAERLSLLPLEDELPNFTRKQSASASHRNEDP